MTGKNDASYVRTTLFLCDAFEIVSCEWPKHSQSAIHQHGWSQCHVLVQEGTFENINYLGFKTETTVHEPGQVISTPINSSHAIKCISEKGKTLHVYVPPMSDKLTKTQLATPSAAELKKQLSLHLSTEALGWSQLTQQLDQIQAASISTHSPYFMNQLFSGVSSETLLADQVLAQTKSTMATFEASPVFTLVEQEVVKSLGELVGWPAHQVEGVTVPGGSSANFMALHCARQRKFPDYKEKGLPAGTQVQIFVSEEAHYSLKKACMVLGFGTSSLISIKADARGRMLVADLKEKIETCVAQKAIPLMVCATAGTTVLGAFDPINEMASLCKNHGIWLHVDGAWGGPVIFSQTHKKLVQGIEKADSLTFDAHKLLGANLTCSFFITNDPHILLAANDVSGADYLFHDNSEVIDRGRLSWQCGRQAEVMSFWTIWKSAGTANLGAFVDRLMTVKDETVAWVNTQSRMKLVAQPEFLNICIQIIPPAGCDEKTWATHVRNELKRKNLAMVNYSTTADGLTFLRLILAHPQLNTNTVKEILTWATEIR
ncbi:MAG: aminotransferase class V-fold PLP-dependent enzyme [Bdellovibrionaceae bacterium]|nr:aminotransferase class V-fold PLP-dependent enzyme [Pseudobdellovibrionaceae bacterium]